MAVSQKAFTSSHMLLKTVTHQLWQVGPPDNCTICHTQGFQFTAAVAGLARMHGAAAYDTAWHKQPLSEQPSAAITATTYLLQLGHHHLWHSATSVIDKLH